MAIHAVDKPLGPTSHDVVAQARRLLRTPKVGHAGTLDPLASGVLVLLIGEATKLSSYLLGADKSYLAWIAFGATTATLDAEGDAILRGDATHVSAAAVIAALPPFLTLEAQRPPAFAAIKQGGVKGYEAARRGAPLDLPERPAGYRTLEWVDFGTFADVAARSDAPLPPPLDPAAPTAVVRATVRSGTYLRAFARDLGAALGVPAHLAGLRRTASGAVTLADAAPLAELATAPSLDPVALLGLPIVALSEREARAVRDGKRIPTPAAGRAALIDPHGHLVAVADASTGVWRSERVWREGAWGSA
jgi:tRNA pseudouridine55 synthase